MNNDGDDNDLSNLVLLCHECHSLKTAQDMGKQVNWGCDVKGRPLDPNHHWNKSKNHEKLFDEVPPIQSHFYDRS
ncbi:HNH endonuclease [Acinetobacter lwoffii]|uniref:HNH endonuclease n=1 Tax=Acinetobacter lwoffii TaxID=28090 RepID=UPI003B9685CB